jgi:hypothetical protein
MKENVIILTSGLSGSSVLTGLIAEAGYWPGDVTHKKEYDTFENDDLIKLNEALIRQAGFKGSYMTEFRPEGIERIAAFSPATEGPSYAEFVRQCDAHAPWVWKDPRLWLTIRFWAQMLDLKRCKFVILTRNYLQCWISATLRRQIRSYPAFRSYEESVKQTLVDFCTEAGVSFIAMEYEDLILRPSRTLEDLNRHLQTNLTIADLERVYHQPLYKKPRSFFDFLKATAIYLKNYRTRLDAPAAKVALRRT